MKYDLANTEGARAYIEWAAKNILAHNGSPATEVTTNTGRTLVFSKLNDDEAVVVANMIWANIHREAIGGLQ